MNDNKQNISLIRIKNSGEIAHRDVAVSAGTTSTLDDGQAPRSTEEYFGLLSGSDGTVILRDREPIFVLVDSSGVSNPSSRELFVDDKVDKEHVPREYCNKNIQPIDMPSTSRDFRNSVAQLKLSDSSDEMQMLAINLLSENDISLNDDGNLDEDSVVISYLRNKDAHLDMEGALLSTKKKSSLLEDVSKMDTITEREHCSRNPINISGSISESSLDAIIPSYPGSPRSLDYLNESSESYYINDTDSQLQLTFDFLHEDHAFIEAAEMGDDRRLEELLRNTNTDQQIQQLDQLGRNALHFAVCSGNERAIILLLKAGINVNVKDNVGMSPLSLCLMRNQSLRIAKLLFDHGACIMPRVGPADTGLFLQFVSVCTPTEEDEEILELLVDKGGLVNDPGAPGGRQALHIAAMGNNVPLINKLVSLGADLRAKNLRGETALQFARIFKCKEAAARLEELEDSLQSSTESTVTAYGTLNTVSSDEYRRLHFSPHRLSL